MCVLGGGGGVQRDGGGWGLGGGGGGRAGVWEHCEGGEAEAVGVVLAPRNPRTGHGGLVGCSPPGVQSEKFIKVLNYGLAIKYSHLAEK